MSAEARMEYEIQQMKRAAGDGLPAVPETKRSRSPTTARLGNVPLGVALPAAAVPHVPLLNAPADVLAGSSSQVPPIAQVPASSTTPPIAADSSASRTAAVDTDADQYERLYGAQMRELRAKSEQVDVLKQHVEVLKGSNADTMNEARAHVQAAAGAAAQAQAESQEANARAAEANLQLDAAGMRVDELERRSAHQTDMATHMNQKYLHDTQLLKNEVESRNATIINLQAQLGSVVAERDTARRRVDEVTAANLNADKLNEGLKQQIRDQSGDVANANARCEKLQAEGRSMVAERDARITDLSQKLTESQVALDRVQSSLTALQAAPPSGDSAAELAHLRSAVATERETVNQLKSRLDAAVFDRDSAAAKTGHAERFANELMAEIKRLQATMGAYTDKIAELERELTKHRTWTCPNCPILQSRIDSLTNQVNESNKEREELKVRIAAIPTGEGYITRAEMESQCELIMKGTASRYQAEHGRLIDNFEEERKRLLADISRLNEKVAELEATAKGTAAGATITTEEAFERPWTDQEREKNEKLELLALKCGLELPAPPSTGPIDEGVPPPPQAIYPRESTASRTVRGSATRGRSPPGLEGWSRWERGRDPTPRNPNLAVNSDGKSGVLRINLSPDKYEEEEEDDNDDDYYDEGSDSNGEDDGEEEEDEEQPTDTAQAVQKAVSHAKAYEKLSIPKFPKAGDTENWLIAMGTNLCVSGGFTDKAEIPWIRECQTKTYQELADGGSERMRKADIALNKGMVSLINSTNEPIKMRLVVKQREAFRDNQTLSGRQVVCLMLEHFKTNKCRSKAYTWNDLNAINLKNDNDIDNCYALMWEIMAAVEFPMPEEEKIGAWMNIFKGSKKLAADIAEFRRFDVDDPRRTFKFLTDSIERMQALELETAARELQLKRIQSGNFLGGNVQDAAPGKGKKKGGGKGGGGGRGGGKGGGSGGGRGSGGGGGGGGGGAGKDLENVRFCMTFARTGKCNSGDCKFKHISRDQLKKMCGFDVVANMPQKPGRSQPPGGNGGGGGGGRGGGGGGGGNGRGKGSAKGAPAEADAAAVELQRLRSAPKLCQHFLKGTCTKGDDCPAPHVEPDVAEELKRAEKVRKENAKARAATPAREQDDTKKKGKKAKKGK